jgi:endonuclease-3
MQRAFDFGERADLVRMRDLLDSAFGATIRSWGPPLRLHPMDQLVKAFISSRTRDGISGRAFQRLILTYPDWHQARFAEPEDLSQVLAGITYLEKKAPGLPNLLNEVAERHSDFDLSLLDVLPGEQVVAWLKRLPGVGIKISASVLNFSTLNRAVFVIDTHVLRILRRIGFVRAKADADRAYEAVMGATEGWSSEEFAHLHDLTKHLGQTVCHATSPRCGICPLKSICSGPRDLWARTRLKRTAATVAPAAADLFDL